MSKNKGNIFTTIISNAISIGVALMISFFVTRYIVTNIGKEAYSFYPIANNFSTYFSIIFLITNSLSSRFIMIPYLKENYEDSSKYCSTVLFSNIIITAIVFFVEIVFYININRIINIPEYLLLEVKKLFMFTFMSSIVHGLTGYFSVGYFVKERMDLQAISSITENIVKGIVILYLLLNNNITIASFGGSLFIASCVKSFLDVSFYFYLMRDIPIKMSSFSIKSLIEITKLGIWSLLSQSGSLLIGNVQLIISNKFINVESAAELALIQPLITTCSLIASTVSRFLDPTITRYISKYSKNSKKCINHIYTIMEICVFIPVIIILSISGPFYKLWIPSEYTNTLYVLTILSCTQLIIEYFALINNSILTTFFKIKQKATVYLMSGILNLVLIFILLTFAELNNIAILLSSIITFIFYHLIFVQRYTKKIIRDNNMDIDFLSVKNYTVYAVLATLDVVIISFIKINGYLLLLLVAFVLFIINIIIILLIRKCNIKEFIQFITTENII